MKKCALFIIGFMIIFCGCRKDYFHDTGLANGKHDCTIWEYMQQDRENWDSTILVIKRAGLQSLFDGTDDENKEITFFGPTNMSIMQFLFKPVTVAGKILCFLCQHLVISCLRFLHQLF